MGLPFSVLRSSPLLLNVKIVIDLQIAFVIVIEKLKPDRKRERNETDIEWRGICYNLKK